MKRIYILIIISCLLSNWVNAQVSIGKAEVVEAYITDHKLLGWLINSRAVTETLNAVLHEDSSEAAEAQAYFNAELEKYKRSLDILLLAKEGVEFSFKAFNSYKRIKETSSSYIKLLDYYKDYAQKHGLRQEDYDGIVAPLKNMGAELLKEGESLYLSITTCIGYATGTLSCKMSDFTRLIDLIGDDLVRIADSIDRSYIATYYYMERRRGYWIYDPQRKKKARDRIVIESYNDWKRVEGAIEKLKTPANNKKN